MIEAVSPEVLHDAWARLPEALSDPVPATQARRLVNLSEAVITRCRHGELPRWLEALAGLPPAPPCRDLDGDVPRLGGPVADRDLLTQRLMELHPWRKGPLEIGGVRIDSEWRSDWKWARVAPYVELIGEQVLDIGCGNGYFGWRMLGAGARCVVGIEPTPVYVMQWLAQAHYAGSGAEAPFNFVLPLRDEDLPRMLTGFDTVLSMGVLYHRRDPARHLRHLKRLLRPGGRLVLETLVLDRPGMEVLVPEGRYARMRNVWHLPTVDALVHEMASAGLDHVDCVDVTPTTTAEQRTTAWMRFESLDRCLDPARPDHTVEGYSAPVRAVVLARTP